MTAPPIDNSFRQINEALNHLQARMDTLASDIENNGGKIEKLQSSVTGIKIGLAIMAICSLIVLAIEITVR